VSVAVQRYRNRGVPHERREGLHVHPGVDHQRGECVSGLVERESVEARPLPGRPRSVRDSGLVFTARTSDGPVRPEHRSEPRRVKTASEATTSRRERLAPTAPRL
jgi:hypothetical protein